MLVTLFTLPLHKGIVSVLIGGLILVATGLFDDRYDLSPYLRFCLNFIAASVAIAGGLGIPYISNPFGSPISLIEPQVVFHILGSTHTIWLIADIAAIIWLMALMNLVNWSKGVDGQLPGYVSLAAIFLAVTAGRFSGHDIPATDTQLFGLIIAGAFAGFLPWNFYPQRIMPGYGGGSLAGYLLGILSILSFGKVGALTIILAVPILDGIYTIIRRILHQKNPFRGDDQHLHHLLLRAGWGRRRIAIFYMCTTALLGCCMLFLEGVVVKIVFASVVYLSLAVWIYMLSKK
jgi:UDP-GlcNAc:undecaprenyl-phosphate GlcNAc-1-phosphate transferase